MFENNNDKFKHYAIKDKVDTLNKKGSGYYQCFCKLNSSIFDTDDDLCYDFNSNYATGLFKTNMVTVLVSVINIIFRKISERMIVYISNDSKSGEISQILTTCFLSNFINTGILLLLITADLEYVQILKFLPLRGVYTDLDESWYQVVAPALIKTMFIVAMMPYAEFCISLCFKFAYRGVDSGFS